MEGCSEKEKDCPQLLHLIHQGERVKNTDEGRSRGSSEEKKLELRLGLPGQEWPWTHTTTKTRDESSLLSLPCFSSMASFPNNNNNGSYAQKSPPIFQGKTQNVKPPLFLHTLPAIPKEIARKPSCPENETVKMQTVEKQPFSPSANNGTQKRTAPPVVGWPPIRSSRRIIASSSSSKTSPEESANEKTGHEKAGEKGQKSQFVKINMDGVPIGRKIDLGAYDSYEKLSSAVDQLFRGLLAAKNDYCDGGMERNGEEKSIEKVLDGSGEYTLVYEDNEGDRMLVGDVPWKGCECSKALNFTPSVWVGARQTRWQLNQAIKLFAEKKRREDSDTAVDIWKQAGQERREEMLSRKPPRIKRWWISSSPLHYVKYMSY